MKIESFASGSGGNCYRLSDGETDILIECGISKRRILECIDYDTSSIKGVLMSHEHGDHSKAAKDLLRLGIDIYASASTFEALHLAGYHCKKISHGQAFKIGSLDIYPFETEHDAAEPLGFVITSRITGERILFFTDTYYLKYVFKGVDIIMGECNYSLKTISAGLPESRRNRLFESHMSLEHFLELLGNYPDVQMIYLLHLSDDNSDADLFRKEIEKKTSAKVYIC